MADFIGEILVYIFVDIIWTFVRYVIVLPLSLIACTPVILFIALFGEGGYKDKVFGNYRKIINFWTSSRWHL